MVFIDWLPAATLSLSSPSLSLSLLFSSSPPSLSQVPHTVSCPSSALFIKFTSNCEKAHTQYQKKTSAGISPVGDCAGVNWPCFIYQTGSVYVRGERNAEHKTLRVERWGATASAPEFFFPPHTCSLSPSFISFFICRTFFLLKGSALRLALKRDVAAPRRCQLYRSVKEIMIREYGSSDKLKVKGSRVAGK